MYICIPLMSESSTSIDTIFEGFLGSVTKSFLGSVTKGFWGSGTKGFLGSATKEKRWWYLHAHLSLGDLRLLAVMGMVGRLHR